MKKYFIACTIVFCSIIWGSGHADTEPGSLYSKANKAYREGNYSTSIQLYESILLKYSKSHEVYFNLGNSYFKENNLGRAILNYERARVLHPLDEDINFNLRMAYNGTIDKIEPVPLLFYQRWWQSLLRSLSPGTWTLMAIISVWVTCLSGVIYLYASTSNGKRNTFLTTLSLCGISCLLYFLAWSANNATRGNMEAIIMTQTSYIRSSPGTRSTKLFMLHEGTKVKIIDEENGWKQIRIANGNVGWVEDNAVEKI